MKFKEPTFFTPMGVGMIQGKRNWEIKQVIESNALIDKAKKEQRPDIESLFALKFVFQAVDNYMLGFEAGVSDQNGMQPDDVLVVEGGGVTCRATATMTADLRVPKREHKCAKCWNDQTNSARAFGP